MTTKSKTKKQAELLMSMDDAITYLKKMDEWDAIRNMDRETVIKWASFLKNREESKPAK
jgi:hypothetical protein